MTEELLGARALRDLLDRHHVRPSKRYGQNFVVDPNTIRKVLAVAGLDPSARVLEIGAGAGSLTAGLASAAGRVIALEVDQRLVGALHASFDGNPIVEIVHGDAMKVDLSSFDAAHLVGNLPYNLAAAIVLRALEEAPQVRSLTVMTQREVGERLAAGPGSRIYGGTSVVVAFYGTAEIAAPVSRRAFYPVPDVDSVIVRVDRRAQPDVDARRFREVVRAAFSQRRKTLRNALGTLGLPDVERVLEAAGVDGDLRAEMLALDAFVEIARVLDG